MSSYAFNYEFNISGNCNAVVAEIAEGVERLNNNLNDAGSMWDSFEGKILALNQLTQYVDGVAQSVEGIMRPGAALNAQLADLSAISGAVGKDLQVIERYARDTAKTFGGSAAQSVESYKLLLSQLSPELTKHPKALQAMGEHIARLSKTMGGDATAAATVLTTAMNQYGVSLDDPMEASRKMAEMMNIMAAAGREGSAELPTIQAALEQSGMAAKAAGVSFAETNAAIQVLDKAGKKGSEGGVALRNVMSILSQGRFLPKDVQEELQAAGVDINALTDKSKTLTERLRPLQTVMQDSALFTKLFGRENSAAAMALVQGIDQVDAWTEAITGTNTAVEQSEVIMDTYNERQSRIQAKFDDIKISIFNACGDFGIWTSLVAQALVPVAQLTPLVLGLGKAFVFLKAVNWGGVWATITGGAVRAYTSLAMFNGYLSIGRVASLGFGGGILQAAVAVVRFATVGIMSGIKAVVAFVASLVTGGTASATFAGIATTSFAAFKTAAITACRAVGVAIMNIPIIGWIAAAIAAIAALFAYFWKTSAQFRGVVKGIGAFFVAIFKGMWDVAKEVLGGIADAIWKCVTFQWDEVGDELSRIGSAFSNYGKAAAAAFSEAYQAEVNAEAEPTTGAAEATAEVQALAPTADPNPIADNLGNIGGDANKADRVKNINVSIERLVENLTIQTTNMHESKERIKDMITEALLSAVNDVNYAM